MEIVNGFIKILWIIMIIIHLRILNIKIRIKLEILKACQVLNSIKAKSVKDHQFKVRDRWGK